MQESASSEGARAVDQELDGGSRAFGARAPARIGRERHAVVEIAIAWGETILSVHALGDMRRFFLGEKTSGPLRAQAFLPAEVLGSESFELLHVDALGVVYVHLPENAQITWRAEGSDREEPIPSPAARGASPLSAAPREVPLPRQARVRMEFGEFSVVVRAGEAKWKGGWAFEKEPFVYFGLSLSALGSLLAALAYFVPPLGLEEEVGVSKERLVLLQQYLEASARREEARPQNQEPRPEAGGASGESAPGASGTVGKSRPISNPGRFAIKKTELSAEERALVRRSELAEAGEFGAIQLLKSASLDASTWSVWGRDSSLGDADTHALGNMWADDIGDAAGSGGLGFAGLDEGGGRRGAGIGLAGVGIGTFGVTEQGPGGFGRSSNLPGGAHRSGAPKVRLSVPETSGRLPPEVIRRTVRQNFGRFRLCYHEGLQRNPALQGRVSVRFVIGRDGAVTNVGLGASDLGDGQVNDCLRAAFYGLSFPPPESGVVQVTYPLLFSAE